MNRYDYYTRCVCIDEQEWLTEELYYPDGDEYRRPDDYYDNDDFCHDDDIYDDDDSCYEDDVLEESDSDNPEEDDDSF